MPLMAEFGVCEPVGRKFRPAVGHVPPPEYTQLEHLFRRQIRREFRVKIFPHRFGPVVTVVFLKIVIYNHFLTDNHWTTCFGHGGRALRFFDSDLTLLDM